MGTNHTEVGTVAADMQEIKTLSTAVETSWKRANRLSTEFFVELLRPSPAMIRAAKAVLVATAEAGTVLTIGLEAGVTALRSVKTSQGAWPVPPGLVDGIEGARDNAGNPKNKRKEKTAN